MNSLLKVLLPWIVVASASVFLADRAVADAIDGNWCHADGRTFSIKGAEIVTPRGQHIDGNYSRHHFSYRVPDSEPAAGQTIFMTLANENTVYLRIGTASDSAPEVWNRCGPTVS